MTDEHPPMTFYMDHSTHTAPPTQSNPMRHAFIVVGRETIFLCHQIMSHMEGHNLEVVLEVKLTDSTKEKLLEDRDRYGKTHYLGNVQKHTLSSIASGRVTAFIADVWNSFTKYPDLDSPWGEKEPIEPWLSGILVEIVRVVRFSHFNENTNGQKHEQYFLFGKEDEAHIYHTIGIRPDYDHVATLRSAPDWIAPDQLSAGAVVSIPSLQWDPDTTYCQNPLPDGETKIVRFYGLTEYRDPMGGRLQLIPELTIDVEKTWWYSTRVLNYFNDNPCPDKGASEIS